MGILQPPLPLSASTGVIPNIKTMCTTDNLATITTAGYLNNLSLGGYPIAAADVLNIEYSFNTATQVGTFGLFTVGINNGVITLTEYQSASGVNATLPTIENYMVAFSNTTGDIKVGIDGIINPGTIQAGLSGTAGSFRAYPPTASRGFLSWQPANNSNDSRIIITNAAVSIDTTLILPNPSTSSCSFLLTAGTNTMTTTSQIVFGKVNGTEAANAVTASGNAGVITTSALTTAGGASYAIVWTNTKISTTSSIQLTLMGGTNTVKNITIQATAGSGTSTLTIYNNTAATALDGTLIIGYFIS